MSNTDEFMVHRSFAGNAFILNVELKAPCIISYMKNLVIFDYIYLWFKKKVIIAEV